MSLPPVIGLNGVARAGKDTVAKILHDLYGYDVYSFSETLNDALIALDPMVGPLLQDFGRVEVFERYSHLVGSLGYEQAKDIPEVRRLLQAMGTEVGRDILGENVWVDALFRRVERGIGQGNGLATITNVRFPNEYDAVKARGGVVWRVTRPGFEPALGHVSDTALNGHEFDHHIHNDGTLRDLADKVMGLLDPVQAAYR